MTTFQKERGPIGVLQLKPTDLYSSAVRDGLEYLITCFQTSKVWKPRRKKL